MGSELTWWVQIAALICVAVAYVWGMWVAVIEPMSIRPITRWKRFCVLTTGCLLICWIIVDASDYFWPILIGGTAGLIWGEAERKENERES